MIRDILAKAAFGGPLTDTDLITLAELEEPEQLQALYQCAYRVKEQYVGKVVYFRGMIECSNICRKDCYYCGIRKSNTRVRRYTLPENEMVREALWSFEQGYGSVVIQAGERSNPAFVAMIERVLRTIKARTGNQLGITLSLGEQSEATYRRWRAAGAHRYLLRIETTNPELYRKLHPLDCSHSRRFRCLEYLQQAGYQVGTGMMIGLPGQTTRDLVDDLLFMQAFDIDMVGMGPYIPHARTPVGAAAGLWTPRQKQQALQWGLKMIAITRIFLKDVNIAAATSLQALADDGREQGLKCGANVIMPNVTSADCRRQYTLYDGKPGLNDNRLMRGKNLEARVRALGESVGYHRWGDSPHWYTRHNRP